MKKLSILLFLLAAACGAESENNNGTVNTNNATGVSNNGTTGGSDSTQTTTSNNGTTSSNTTNSTSPQTNNTNNTNNNTNTGEDVPMTEIFQAAFSETGCVVGYCHGGAVDGLVISDPAMSVTAMVNVDSVRPACNLTKLVVPGKPEESLLWMRVRPAALEDGEPCVPKMPKGTDGLNEEKAKLIYDWIAAGAKL